MTYLKCTLAGLAALFLVFGIVPILAILVNFLILTVRHGGAAIHIRRPRLSSGSPLYWISVLLIFAVGYYWEFRRVTK